MARWGEIVHNLAVGTRSRLGTAMHMWALLAQEVADQQASSI